VALSMGQVSVGTGATFICSVPSGLCEVVLTAGTGATVVVGSGTAVTTANGAVLAPDIPTPVGTFPSSTGASLYGVASSSTVTVSYIISTAR
jgi:hypothetical protein